MNILVFCSNPINGGTVRIFYELVISMRKMLEPEHKVFACINQGNTVEIYKKIDNIIELPIISEADVFMNLYGGNVLKRIFNYIQRKIRFYHIKKANIHYMNQLLMKNNINAVIIHNGGYVGDDLCNQMLTSAYNCKKKLKYRIYVLHNDIKKNFCSKIRFFLYDKKISKEATSIVTVSNYTKNRIKRFSYITKEIQVIYNRISDNRQMKQADKQKIIQLDPMKFHILMIGNFMENKGHHKFIEAAKELIKHSDTYQFVIIGNIYDRDYFIKCKKLIDKWELDNDFQIYSNINNAAEYIDLFDVLVVPSLYDESFGLISLEAMAANCPVVAFACGGIPEVVRNGETGFIVPIGDTIKMADKIQWIKKNKFRFVWDKYNYKKNYSVEVMASQYIKLLGIKKNHYNI